MDPTMDPSGGADSPAGGQAQQPPGSLDDSIAVLGANHNNPVTVMPNQIQLSASTDDHGRRYMVLENLPLNRNYVAHYINDGREFAIGGTPRFICEALASELEVRAIEDSESLYPQSWHVVVLPDSNMSNAPRFNLYRRSPASERYPVATNLRPNQQNPLNNQLAVLPRQNPSNNQQPLFPRNNFMGGHGRASSSVAPSQQSQFTTPMPGVLRSGSGSMMKIPEAQFYSLPPQQGSFQAFHPNNGPAQGYDQRQRNDRTFNQSNGPLMGSLPQVHRPVFDRHGYIVGEEGNIDDNYMYISNMYGNRKVGLSQPKPFQGAYERLDPPQWAQNAEMSDVQLVAAAESFLFFVKANMGQDEDNQNENHQDEVNEYEAYQEERDQDEGVALGNTKANHNNRSTSKQAAPYQAAAPSRPPESSHGGLVRAGEREPHRFADKTGMGLCDYCGRDGHEADACIKWDPVHFDKPVCTACNNDQHSLDECPKFGAMPPRDKAALLLDKGARRPGVRGENHAWTSYVRRRGCYYREGGGLPLTRVFLFVLLSSRGSGAGLQDIWKVWDYGRGVPDQFRDLRAESLAGNPATPLDERFMGGEHQLSLIARAPVGTVGAATARTGAGLQPPHPREAPSVARNQNQRQRQPQSRLQAGSDGEEEDEAL